jgi:hypothetical protein
MPQRRHGYTTSVTIGDADSYLTANPNQDGILGEGFIKFGKQGSTLGGLLDAVSISTSIGLQSGVPVQPSVIVTWRVISRQRPSPDKTRGNRARNWREWPDIGA